MVRHHVDRFYIVDAAVTVEFNDINSLLYLFYIFFFLCLQPLFNHHIAHRVLSTGGEEAGIEEYQLAGIG